MTTARKSQICGHIWVIEVIISMYRRCYQSGGAGMVSYTPTKDKMQGRVLEQNDSSTFIFKKKEPYLTARQIRFPNLRRQAHE